MASAERKPRPSFVAGDLLGAFILTMLLAAVPLARHNLRLGRADGRGALRLATPVFLVSSYTGC